MRRAENVDLVFGAIDDLRANDADLVFAQEFEAVLKIDRGHAFTFARTCEASAKTRPYDEVGAMPIV